MRELERCPAEYKARHNRHKNALPLLARNYLLLIGLQEGYRKLRHKANLLPSCLALHACHRFNSATVQQLTADGAVLTSFTAVPGPYSVAVVEHTNGLPSTLAVASVRSNAIYFFQRTL